MSNAFMDRIGITSEERVVNAFNMGSDLSTRNIGLLVERERGIENKPVLVTSLKEDKRIFGEHNPNMYSSYVVESLLNNTGGYSANIYQVRVVGTGTVAASAAVMVGNAGTQTFTSVVTQIPSNLNNDVQINELSVSNVEIGDKFNFSIASDNPSFPSETYSTSIEYTASTTVVADVIVAVQSLIAAALSSLPIAVQLRPTSSLVSGKIRITSLPQRRFIVSTTTVNSTANSQVIFNVVAGRQGDEDKGAWGNNISLRVYLQGDVNGSPDGYKMDIFYKGYLVETYISRGSSWKTLIDAVNQRSEFVIINPIDLTAQLNQTFYVAMSGGVYVAPTDNDFEPRYHSVTQEPLGMAIFEGVDVQILACAEVFSQTFVSLCSDFAFRTRKFFVFNLPYLATESVAQSYYTALATPDQSSCSGNLNWAEVSADMDGNKIWIPSVGYIIGAAYIRKAGLYNGYVWTPPAGVETNSKGIFRFTHDSMSDTTLSRMVKKWRCNVIKHIKNVGYCVYSSRTYSNNPLFESIHIRLQTNWILSNVEIRNEKYLQRIGTPSLEKDLKTDNLVWFKNLYEQGGIERSVSFDTAVVIKVGTILGYRKEMEIEIAWIPPECIEHIHIKMSRNDGILILNF